jgi:hypothetical protein
MSTRNILLSHPVWIAVGNTTSIGILVISGDSGAALEQLIEMCRPTQRPMKGGREHAVITAN